MWYVFLCGKKKSVLYTSMTEKAPWFCCVSQTGSSHWRACTCRLCAVLWGLHSGEWPALVQAGTSILDIRMLGTFPCPFQNGIPKLCLSQPHGVPRNPISVHFSSIDQREKQNSLVLFKGPSNLRLLVGARCWVLSHTGRSEIA